MSESERWKLEWQSSWQLLKRAWLNLDLLQVLKRKPLIALGSPPREPQFLRHRPKRSAQKDTYLLLEAMFPPRLDSQKERHIGLSCRRNID